MQVSAIQHHSPLGKSDHRVVSFKFHCYLDFTKAKESYAYAKGDYVSMRNELENSKWLRNYMALNEQTTIDDKWISLKSKLVELKEKFVPKQSISSWKNKGCFPINKRTQKAIKSAQAKTNPKKVWSHTRRNLKTKSGVTPLLANIEDNNSQSPWRSG